MLVLATAFAPVLLTVNPPAGPATPTAPATISYLAKLDGKSAVITTSAGGMRIVGNELQITSAGTVLARMPLAFHLNDKRFPIDASISGNTATLTPSMDLRRAIPAPPVAALSDVAAYKTREERDKAAFNQMKDQIGFSVTVGAIVGAVIAAAAGCLIGGVVALPSAVLTAIFGPLAGCVAAAVIMAPVGGIIGTLFVAAPVAVLSAVQYFTTIGAPL